MRMFVVKDNVHIAAPIERCFLLSTSLALVEREMKMRPVAGKQGERTSGLVVGGDRIRWVGWQFGLPQHHVSLISAYEPYRFFQDTMVAGRFRSFKHDHEFTEIGGQVLLKDTIRFSLPFGSTGQLVGKYMLVPRIREMLARRFNLIRRTAESDEWRKYLPE
jgi:ligand-binding SRPBCC domain-containing protein